MKTDDLIDALAVGLEPTRPARLDPRMLALAALAATLALVVVLGLRPHPGDILTTPSIWLKGVYTVLIAGGALWLALRLGRPGARTTAPAVFLSVVLGVALLWGGVELAMTPAGERMADWLGRTWTICGRNILMLSLAAGAPTFLSARRLAPTRPAQAGLALGLAAGGIAATAYGVLHCPEATAAFVATWYTLGIAAAGAVGALAGRFALRW
ncbi:NrsF family protein [Brevundimonas sp. FT23042]|uniref:NrsF family protein n=1 Tax=Brevundimonas sp. FT23042 TaxID=3393749 RepID=UPI003B58714B